MSRMLIVIGDGDSEKYFVSSLCNKFDWKNQTEKINQNYLYTKDKNFIFLPFPGIKGGSGQSRLFYPDTYTLISEIIRTIKYQYGISELTIDLVVLADTDGGDAEDKIVRIKNAVNLSSLKNFNLHTIPVRLCLESWYFAGLNENVDIFKKSDQLSRLLTSDIDDRHTKNAFINNLNEYLGQIKTASLVAKAFSRDEARKYSESYIAFDDILKHYLD